MSIDKYEYHPLSNLFPLMEGDEFDRLVDDIDKNGLLEPIVLFEGKILDGRNRYRACMKLGRKPTFKKYPNRINPLTYVVAENIRRRHLEKAQLAEIALLVMEIYEEQEREERYKDWEEAKEEYEKKKEKYLLRKERVKRPGVPPKEPEPPKEPTTTEIRKKVAKDLVVNEEYIRQAKKVKEIAEKQPKIAQEWEKAKKGNTSVTAVYNKALQVGLPPKTENMDQKMINKFQQFNKEIRLKLRKDLLIPYSENTRNVCKRYVRLIINHLMNEFEIGGVIDG